MRRFYLDRRIDASGVSGSGRIAEGCEFSNGWCALTWMTGKCTHSWYSTIDELEAIHGHGGATQVTWVDEPKEEDTDEDLS